MDWTVWMFIFLGLVAAGSCWALWLSWRDDIRSIVVRDKNNRAVDDEMLAERAREEAQIDALSPEQRIVEFDKTFPGGSE